MSEAANETTISGSKYRFGKMDPRTQFHVARRLGPLYGAIVSNVGAGGSADLGTLIPMIDVIAGMDDDKLDYILDRCLAVTERETTTGSWTKIVASNGRMMFDDIDMKAMLQLAWGVIQQDLKGFFPESP